jgi:hypothetical protein
VSGGVTNNLQASIEALGVNLLTARVHNAIPAEVCDHLEEALARVFPDARSIIEAANLEINWLQHKLADAEAGRLRAQVWALQALREPATVN